ncbi:hypothetical protein SAMN05216317_12716 [Nitrosomonas eutropha]|uniref:hypothetical protein n=1 Tax=Nitrosomonas TaxID=914 RepID=UPI00087E8467|nr:MULTISPECIES: hypothetical protein [Nitrosomonas]MXS79536.1 hypothetical protein [Nitrosomonas sp. GH22]SCX27211.1 hypothetical protein SAMN05216379_1372 [Nitrosomonas eutropha]SDX06003.1 hypothetical protein SAMN05216317_12716 [Nitrosomonas eutropha]
MFELAPTCRVNQITEKAAKDMAYVTKSTYTKLSGGWLQPEGRVSIDWIFDFIYEESLASILNQPEAERLYVQKLMLEGKYRSLRIKKQTFSPKYVFSVGMPKFHKTNECHYLTVDFTNYLVPPQISARGAQEVRKFQAFCEQTKKELKGRPDDVFWARVGAKFHIQINPQSVCYENSGVQGVSAMTIAELQQQIRKTVDVSLDMQNGDDGAVIKRVRHAPHIQKALACTADPKRRAIVEQFFTLKRQLINLLFELYRKQMRVVNHVLPIHLLQASGLEPCRKCWGEREAIQRFSLKNADDGLPPIKAEIA